jgi:hypothetical protein
MIGCADFGGVFAQDGTPALVLELIEGPTLADRLRAGTDPYRRAPGRLQSRSRRRSKRRTSKGSFIAT